MHKQSKTCGEAFECSSKNEIIKFSITWMHSKFTNAIVFVVSVDQGFAEIPLRIFSKQTRCKFVPPDFEQ